MSNMLITVDFKGQQINAVDADGQHYVAMKPICDNIGIQWEAQLKRIKRHPVLKSVMSIMDATGYDGKIYEMVLLPLEYLNGWLFGIDATRIKDQAIQSRLITYQQECFRVLDEYWRKPITQSLQRDGFDVIDDKITNYGPGSYIAEVTLEQHYSVVNNLLRLQEKNKAMETELTLAQKDVFYLKQQVALQDKLIKRLEGEV